METERLLFGKEMQYRLARSHFEEDTADIMFGNEDTRDMLFEIYMRGYKAGLTDLCRLSEGLVALDGLKGGNTDD